MEHSHFYCYSLRNIIADHGVRTPVSMLSNDCLCENLVWILLSQNILNIFCRKRRGTNVVHLYYIK